MSFLDHYSSNKLLHEDFLLLNSLIGNNEEEVLLQPETGKDLGYISDEKITKMMEKITSITNEDAEEFMKVIGEITTNNTELKSKLENIRQEIDAIKSPIGKRTSDESNKIEKETLEKLKKNYENAKQEHIQNRIKIKERINTYNDKMKQQALEVQRELAEEERRQFVNQLKDLQESNIDPSIFKGLDDSLDQQEELAITVLGDDSGRLTEEELKPLENPPKSAKTNGGGRTKKRRNMRRKSKRRKSKRRKSKRRKSKRRHRRTKK